jgi:F-type H+-transporting ATPase subunit a
VAAETKIDPMHQFQISPLAGHLDGSPFVFTNSALWMLVVLALIWLFMLGGMKRELVPGRWQVMVEGVTGFVNSMLTMNVGAEGRKYVPWVFTIFMFILFANLLCIMPLA